MVQHCHARGKRGEIIDEFVTTVLASVEMSEVLDRTAQLLRKHYGRTRVGITLVVRDDPTLAEVLLVDDPSTEETQPGQRFAIAGTLFEQVVTTGQPATVGQAGPDGAAYAEQDQLVELGYGTLACFPLRVDEQVIGTLDIAHQPQCGLLCECTDTAGRIARLVGIALHNSMLVAEVRRLNRELNRENAYLWGQLRMSPAEDRYVAHSGLMKQVLEQAHRVAPSETTVLIRGETGTGKEGLARQIHEFSGRSSAPFVVVNVGAIPETLIESELFGHERGAFTGATARRLGKFEQAEGGTLFLDEIGDAPPSVQVKLLRALQEKEIQRVGGDRDISVDVRVVAATHRRLDRMIEEGTFRSDLYYRLAIFPLHLPPLRERRADIRPLVEHLVHKHAAKLNRRTPTVPDRVMGTLEARDWPGNIRELENFLERALIISRGDTLELPDVPGFQARGIAPVMDAGGAPGPFEAEVEALLRRALEATDGKIYGADGAAALLDLRPTTLQGKLRRFGLKG
jgi:formate hydrogenlyase transcriptional activator